MSFYFPYRSLQKKFTRLSHVFDKYGKEGTIVIVPLKGEQVYTHNYERAHKRLSPASTFKIVNTLIALETKVLKDENEIIPWDGINRDFSAWNKNQTLKPAFQNSCLWAYQCIASKVGKETYRQYLQAINYGNQNPGPELTTFWLKGGDLEITPFEQVQLLKAIYQQKYELFSKRSYDILKKIMLGEKTKKYALYLKTGAATENWVGHGWYIGYIETKENTWFFATNITINEFDDLALRKEITFECLKAKGIIDLLQKPKNET